MSDTLYYRRKYTQALRKQSELRASIREAKAESDRRLALLKQWNDKRVQLGQPCLFCGASVQVETIEGLVKYIDNHADGCELAEELK